MNTRVSPGPFFCLHLRFCCYFASLIPAVVSRGIDMGVVPPHCRLGFRVFTKKYADWFLMCLKSLSLWASRRISWTNTRTQVVATFLLPPVRFEFLPASLIISLSRWQHVLVEVWRFHLSMRFFLTTDSNVMTTGARHCYEDSVVNRFASSLGPGAAHRVSTGSLQVSQFGRPVRLMDGWKEKHSRRCSVMREKT